MSRPTWDPSRIPEKAFAHGAVTLCGAPFQGPALAFRNPCGTSRDPGGQAPRFGLLRVRSPLLAESRLISSPRGTEMFHFPRYRAPRPMDSGRGGARRRRIAPFGNPRIEGRMRLPGDYRGLPRPSSPAVAKASVMRPDSLAAGNSGGAAASPGVRAARHRRAPGARAIPGAHGARAVTARAASTLFASTLFHSTCDSITAAGFSRSFRHFQTAGKGRPRGLWWARLDSNQGLLPYQRSALNRLSYAPGAPRDRGAPRTPGGAMRRRPMSARGGTPAPSLERR